MVQQAAIRIDGVLNVAVPVSDHERALDFYVKVLGLEKRRDASFGPGMRWVEVAPEGAQTTIALAPATSDRPAGVDTGIRLGTPDAAAAHATLRARGANVEGEIMRFGEGVPPMFFLRDPDGNRLVVVEAA